MKTRCESAEKVASIDDIIIEILLNLPASSLLRFKSVSKHWLSIITSPHLSRLHIRRHLTHLRPSGLFIPIDETQTQPQYRYLTLNSTSEEPLSRTITFPSPSCPNGMRILQSCNGLLLCTSCISNLFKYFVYNPTTGQLTTIPLPPLRLTGKLGIELIYHTALAFDPSTSPHYKLVFADLHRLLVYSSVTQLWKVCGDQPFKNYSGTNLSNGVYLDGAVHYMSYSHNCIYLKIDEERLETMTMPPKYNNTPIYFGQSGGRLHLITASDRRDKVFDVYEMEKDYSKWCVRYHVDFREVRGRIEIMGIVREEREEDSFLVLNTIVYGFISFMKYKFADKTMKTLFGTEGRRSYIPKFARPKVYEFIQYLYHG